MAKLKFCLIDLLVITSTCHLFAQTWCPPIRVSQYDTSFNWYYIIGHRLTSDNSGTPWCGWVVDCYANSWIHGILVSHYTDNAWSTPDTIHPFHVFNACDLATDANGNVWVVAAGDFDISACFYNGTSWSGLMQVPTQGTCCHSSVATGDSLGNLWVCWHGGGPGDGHHIWGNTYIQGQWGPPVLISYPGSHDEWAYSMTTDKQGNVWVGWSGAFYRSIKLCTSFNDGSGWSDTMVIAEYATMTCGPALTVDTSGKVWAAWFNRGISESNVYASYYDGNAWSDPMLVSSEPVVFLSLIAITSDDAGKLWLTWMNPDTNICYSYWNGNNWSNPAPVDTHPARDGDPAMTYDGERIWVTWIREIGSDRYAIYASYTYGVGVEEKPAANPLSSVLRLSQNYPNPFSSKTSISYQLQADCYISLKIYDTAGNLVRTSVNKDQKAGHYIVNWNGRDNVGTQLPAGIYFLRLETSNKSITKKIVKLE